MSDPLLSPYSLKGLTLRNRIVSTSHEPAYSEDGLPKDRYRAYQVAKAQGGVGLTMLGGSSMVSRETPQAFGNLEMWRDDIVPWMLRLTEEVHEHGAAVMTQLTHLGQRMSNYAGDWIPAISASEVFEPAHRTFTRAAEDWDLDRICDDFVSAAQRSQASGLDGIELMAYGHLLDSFWTPFWNCREDDYNGSLAARMRFPLRVIEAVRAEVGPDYVVGIRMTFDEEREGGLTQREALEIARHLVDAGIDFISVIRGSLETDAALSRMIPPMGTPSAPHLAFAGTIRAELGVPVMHAGRIADIATARHAISNGLLDLVGMTRALIADPDLPSKVAAGDEDRIRPCIGAAVCIDSIYSSGSTHCIHNAATGREAQIPQRTLPAATPRRTAVVGGGPGGLEAARVLAERGHGVTLFEASSELGGQVLLGAHGPDARRDLIGVVDWRRQELKRLGVVVHLSHYAEAEELATAFDVVIVATGGLPSPPPGLSGAEHTLDSWDVLSGVARPAGSVLVYDAVGGNAGLDVAEKLAGNAVVELVTPERSVAPEIGAVTLAEYAKRLGRLGVGFTVLRRLVDVRLLEDKRREVTLAVDSSEIREVRVVDAVVLESGTSPARELYDDLVASSSNGGAVDYTALVESRPQAIIRNPEGSFQLFRIGDAVASRNIAAAVLDATRLCQSL